MFHNEALQLLDVLVAAAVEEPPRTSPPAAPAVGSCYLVADAATGEWVGKEQALAAFTGGGWRYLTPVDGLTAYVRSVGLWAAFRSGAWEMGALRGSALLIGDSQVVGARAAAIGAPAGGSVVDAEARTAINQILATMRQHGLIET